MDMSEQLREVQQIVGTVVDGVYGPKTADAIITKLRVKSSASTLAYKTRNIQKHVNVWVDGIFGPKTTAAVLKVLKEGIPVLPDISPVSKYPEEFKPTPNKSRRKIKPLGVVLHHSCGNYTGGVSWILNPESDVSYHVLIDKDGKRTRFAYDDERAWHAGVSKFKDKRGCNDFMLGVSFTDDTNTRELTDAEVESAVEFIASRIVKYNWPRDLTTITTHREVSPGRKDDVDTRAEKRVLDALRAKLLLQQ